MRAIAWIPLMGAVGVGLLSVPLFLTAGAQLTARMNRPALLDRAAGTVAPPAPRDDFERAMREAERWHIQSWRVVNDQRYAVEAWDSAAADQLDQAAWRGELLARDLGGCLRRARRIARQAAALAHTPEEQYRVALLLALLAREAGDHGAEGQQVRVLARLAPHSLTTQLWLRHAGRHLW
jgi:uncharacterized membrane protein